MTLSSPLSLPLPLPHLLRSPPLLCLPLPLSQDPDASDTEQLIRGLLAHRSCGPHVRVIVELLRPRSSSSGGGAIWDEAEGLEAFCTDPVRFQLLARR